MTRAKALNLILLVVLIGLFVFGRNDAKRNSPNAADTQSEVYTNHLFPSSELLRHKAGKVRQDGCSATESACESAEFSSWSQPVDYSCHIGTRNGYSIPDPRCTPGGIDPSVSLATLQNPHWRTRCIRNCWTSGAEKQSAYRWYGIHKPASNSEENQACELDHLVPLELGGSDSLANIWPQCGADSANLNKKYFKQKDRIERYLATEVKAGRMKLEVAQSKIAEDWTQFVPDLDQRR